MERRLSAGERDLVIRRGKIISIKFNKEESGESEGEVEQESDKEVDISTSIASSPRRPVGIPDGLIQIPVSTQDTEERKSTRRELSLKKDDTPGLSGVSQQV